MKKWLRIVVPCVLGITIILICGVVYYGKDINFLKGIASSFNISPYRILVDKKEISASKVEFVESTTLSVSISVLGMRVGDISNISLDGRDIFPNTNLASSTLIQNDHIDIDLKYLLKPGPHKIDILYSKGNSTSEITSSFVLSFLPLLGESIAKSDFFFVPDSTRSAYSDSWYIENRSINIGSLSGKQHASLAFIYPFADIDLSFSFSPKGEETDLAFYFLQRGRTFVIGNGNNQRMTLLRQGTDSVNGTPFRLEVGKEYVARILRKDNTYSLFLRTADSSEEVKIISFTDTEDKSITADSVGFSVWPGTTGVSINDLRFFPATP